MSGLIRPTEDIDYQLLSCCVYSANKRPDLFEAIQSPDHPLESCWPAFVGQTAATLQYWNYLTDLPALSPYQFIVAVRSSDGSERVIGRTNSIPFHRRKIVSASGDEDFEPLPDAGWDAILSCGIALHLDPSPEFTPNTLSALSVTVDPAYRGKGVAKLLINTIKNAARSTGLSGPVVPVRPTFKSKYQDVDMSEYILWRRSGDVKDDLPTSRPGDEAFDPWLRTHVALGARIVKVAPRSMLVVADAAAWTRWTGIDITREVEGELNSGRVWLDEGRMVVHVLIPGGLVPLKYSLSEGVARYVEPNVWVAYQ
ncbi:hypothetical protein C8R45DRAFT_922300 [Mycena sanguinolenta]|nr:hypothetical protein C8R45DRAFT_922300 [Mycena sanguinolenta]